MKKILAMAMILLSCGCSVNASKLSESYAKDFASKVVCATGAQGVCFCFVASRKTASPDSTGLGMTIDHTGKLCK